MDEEFAMQRSWRTDGDKITFIICKPLLRTPVTEIADSRLRAGVDDTEENMLGDVNLFISVSEDDQAVLIGELELMIADCAKQGKGYGRLALMAFLKYVKTYEEQILREYHVWASCKVVAEEYCASEGHRTDQSDDFRSDGAEERHFRETRFGYLRVRIGKDNRRSQALFEHAGFQLQSPEPNYFGELEMRTYGRLFEDTHNRLTTDRWGESWKDSSWTLLKYHSPTGT